MEATSIPILNSEGYESISNFQYLSQQKFQFILGELKRRLTESIQVKLESIVNEEAILRLTVFLH